MTSQPLNRPYIGITIQKDDYRKVKGLLPMPSYKDTLYSRTSQNLTLIYVIDGYITSYKQYRWISNIKLGLEQYLCVPFKYEEDFIIKDMTEVTNCIYSIDELSKAFKAQLITYPKIMYPSTKKDLYRCLCWYGKRLIHQKCFTKEAMIATALLMNKKLDDKYQYKELHKKALGAYMFIDQEREQLKIRLDEKQLKAAHSKGANITNARQRQITKQRIDEAIATGNYFKPNGKVNKTLLAEALNMHRRTLDKYL